jgi:hypothetical protein
VVSAWVRGFVVSLLLTWVAWAGDSPLKLKSGVSIVEEWTAGQHLYLKGNIGVSQGQLVGLEKWISVNAPNWTVLLVESSSGETYKDARGETYHGMDAVEHAMGKGLPSRTSFGDLKHPKTGEANGAFFILFLKDRKFSFYGSTAYERRGLSSRNWAGNLDREAKRSMRNGGRIVDAAKETIKLVDASLAGNLRKEEKRRTSKIREEAQLKVALAGWIRELEPELTRAAEAHATFRVRFPEDASIPSDVALFDLPELEGLLHGAVESLKAGDASQARRFHDVLKNDLARFYRERESFENDRSLFDPLITRLREAGSRGRSVSIEEYTEALSTAESAKVFYSKGNLKYREYLRLARDAESRFHETEKKV